MKTSELKSRMVRTGKHRIQQWMYSLIFMFLGTGTILGQTIPYTFYNNSSFADNQIYIAVVGQINNAFVWMDCKTSSMNPMDPSYNTVQGPVIGGNEGPGNNGLYANCFTRLSDIPNKTIQIPQIAGCRILISFNSQLFLYFFGSTGAPSGYAAPNLANATDPNQGIRFETIELTYNTGGLWCNTTRVDSYQYPMGLEVWGNNGFYKKVGELKTHDQIIAEWKATAPAEFQGCLDATNNIIHFPSKTAAFQPGGVNANYFQSYIDAVWAKYANADLVFNSGQAGIWTGRVSGNAFVFTRASDGQVATISNKPTTLEAMEGSGVLASGGQWDKVVQAQVCAAINRHAIDLNAASGVTQDWSVTSNYYQTAPYNWYCKFWHQADISYNQLTYAFCYDDVFNQSSTINASSPTKAVITIGGFAGLTTCTPTAITPYVAVNGGAWQQTNTATLAAGGSFTLGPQPLSGGTWSWTGPNGFTSTSREISFSNVLTSQGGNYVATYTNTGGCQSSQTFSITVTAATGTNLALNKPVTVSSLENSSYPGSNAVDGNYGSRWSSAFSDPQWIYVDLGATYNINRVKISWEAAYGKDFQIQVSSDAATWTTIQNVSGNTSQTDDYTGLSGTGRYVRMYGTARGTVYGYSIYELEVYGTAASGGGCSLTNSGGDYSVSVSNDASNPTLTFIPARSGVGSPTCILYYNTSSSGTFPGYTVTPNSAYKINASAGQTIYFYYTYSVPEGGEKNTMNNMNSFTVGNCSSLKAASVAQISGTEHNVGIFPNPATHVVYFSGVPPKSVIKIYSMGGILVKQVIARDAAEQSVDISNLPSGVYMIHILGSESQTFKLLKN